MLACRRESNDEIASLQERKPPMTTERVLINLGKLILCALAFAVGIILGGMLAALLKLPAPTPPQGADVSAIALYSMLATPLLALALALIARGLGGSFLTRALSLAFFTWTAYTLNTQLEASIFSAYATGFWFAVVDYLVPSLLCGAAVAFLFPPETKGAGLIAAIEAFFAQRAPLAWVWRLAEILGRSFLAPRFRALFIGRPHLYADFNLAAGLRALPARARNSGRRIRLCRSTRDIAGKTAGA
jgi:hypothetical protein